MTFTSPAYAENKALLSSIEEAKIVLTKVEKDIDENIKSIASTCLYAASALKELSVLQAEFMGNQIEDFFGRGTRCLQIRKPRGGNQSN